MTLPYRVTLLALAPIIVSPVPSKSPEPLVFREVTVISMTDSIPRPGQTVVIQDGRIAAIGPVGTVAIPNGAFVLPVAKGTFLLPGLADMHVHIFDRAELILFLANGITTVRNLHGIERHLAWRDSLDQNRWLGPRLLTSGPILDGSPPSRSTNVVLKDSQQAELEVNHEADLGYDYIKIYDNLPPELYRVVGERARVRGLTMIGHLPTPVGLDGLFRMHLQAEVQHLEEFLPFFDGGRDLHLLDSVSRTLARLQIVVVPTVSVFTSAKDQSFDLATHEKRPELAFMNPATMKQWGWAEVSHARSGQREDQGVFGTAVRFFLHDFLPSLRKAGVTIVAGTDAPIPMIVPGFSLQGELESYVEAGFTPYRAIRTATIDAAKVLPARRTDLAGFGTITVGAPADLILLSANPLTDIRNLRRPLGVVARGRWSSRAELDAGLDSLARRYRAE